MSKPILCLDFDGVIHRYDSGWQGATTIADDVTEGFFEWLDDAAQYFKIVVYSSRSKEPGASDAMALWLNEQRRKWRERGGTSIATWPVEVEFADTKPAAFLQIDDRAICFDGDWSKLGPKQLLDFKPWNKGNTRVQPKPEVAPDDEALITSLEMESAAVSECFQNGSQDEIHEATDDLKKAREALRRRIAELRATSLKYQLAFGDRDNDAHRLADRVAELEAALAACRDAGDLLYKALVDSDEEGLVEAAEPMRMWRALKTKEPTNG